MNEQALSWAKQQEELLRQKLGSMYTGLTSVKDSATAEAELRKNQLLSTIDNNINKTNTAYAGDTRQAYISKLLNEQDINSELSRYNLSASGYGSGQRSDNRLAYDATRANLQTQKASDMNNFDLSKINAENIYGQDVQGINTEYLTSKGNLDKYINDTSMDYGNKMYNNSVDEQRYKDSLKQQAFDNNLALKEFYKKEQDKVDPNFDSTGRYIGVPVSKNPYGASNANTRTDAKTHGVMSNGYQPKGIGLDKVKATTSTVGDILGQNAKGSTGVPIGTQKVWKTAKDTYWYWDGTQDKYIRI